LLRERTGSSLQECREALEASNGDVDAATALLKGRQAPATWCHSGVRDDLSFAILLELAGEPSAEARGQVEALLQTALQADDDATAADALSHPIVQRFTLVRLPPGQTGVVAARATYNRAVAVVLTTESTTEDTMSAALWDSEELAGRMMAGGFRFAHIEDVPEPELALWLERARGTDADKDALLRTLALSAAPNVARDLSYCRGWGIMPRTLIAIHRLDRGSNAKRESLRDVSPCLVPGPLVVAGRAVVAKMSVGAMVDFSDRVRRWGDDHRVAASLIVAGTSSRWHTLPRDEVVTAPLVVGIVVARGPVMDCTKVDRALCLSSIAALDAVPAAAWSELAGALPDAERAQLVQAPNAVHVAAVGAMVTQLVFGKKGTENGTSSINYKGSGGPYLEYYKSGEERDLSASSPGVRGELIATAEMGTTAVADLGDAAHAGRSQRLPRMQYYVVPSFEVEPQDLY
jgi:hypothetical protein